MATVDEILNKAISYIGTKESPPNSNNVVFNTHYYGKSVSGSAYPWCAVFCWDIFRMCNASNLFCGGQKVAYCPTIENYYKSNNTFYSNTQGKRGDLCIMDFGKGRASHIGIVEKKNSDGTYTIIEGNTSTSSNDNGGSVMKRIRRTSVIRGFCRPKYSNNSSSTSSKQSTSTTYSHKQFVKDVQSSIGVKVDGIAGNKTLSKTVTVSKTKNNKHKVVKPIQKYLNALGYSCGTADGIFGNKTDSAVKSFQKSNGCVSDGIITAKNKTWKKLLGMK